VLTRKYCPKLLIRLILRQVIYQFQLMDQCILQLLNLYRKMQTLRQPLQSPRIWLAQPLIPLTLQRLKAKFQFQHQDHKLLKLPTRLLYPYLYIKAVRVPLLLQSRHQTVPVESLQHLLQIPLNRLETIPIP
jgi:hypothetical protein